MSIEEINPVKQAGPNQGPQTQEVQNGTPKKELQAKYDELSTKLGMVRKQDSKNDDKIINEELQELIDKIENEELRESLQKQLQELMKIMEPFKEKEPEESKKPGYLKDESSILKG